MIWVRSTFSLSLSYISLIHKIFISKSINLSSSCWHINNESSVNRPLQCSQKHLNVIHWWPLPSHRHKKKWKWSTTDCEEIQQANKLINHSNDQSVSQPNGSMFGQKMLTKNSTVYTSTINERMRKNQLLFVSLTLSCVNIQRLSIIDGHNHLLWDHSSRDNPLRMFIQGFLFTHCNRIKQTEIE